MPGQKYIVASIDSNFQTSIKNILNTRGYTFLCGCSDAMSLMRNIRTYTPDMVIIDFSYKMKDVRTVIEAIDDEMICVCVVVGEDSEMEIADIIEKSRALSYCEKHYIREALNCAVELGILNFKRIAKLEHKIKELAESYETRKAVEKAKWILIQKHAISEEDAYHRIQKKSMDTRMTMRAIADAIICTYEVIKG